MTEDEARAESFALIARLLGLDEFQQIAANEMLNDLGEIDFPNVTPEQEKKLMALGALVSENMGFWK